MRRLRPGIPHPSIEHVVPQCHAPATNVTRDMHNLLVIPTRLNVHRNNYRYTTTTGPDTDWATLDALGYLCNSTFPKAYAHKNVRRQLFVPPVEWRGRIARKVCYMIATYPIMTHTIVTRVLCPRLIRHWNDQYPVTDDERHEEAVVASIQKNRNRFVVSPLLVNATIESSACPKSSACVCLGQRREPDAPPAG
jgi:endonuclease I